MRGAFALRGSRVPREGQGTHPSTGHIGQIRWQRAWLLVPVQSGLLVADHRRRVLFTVPEDAGK